MTHVSLCCLLDMFNIHFLIHCGQATLLYCVRLNMPSPSMIYVSCPGPNLGVWCGGHFKNFILLSFCLFVVLVPGGVPSLFPQKPQSVRSTFLHCATSGPQIFNSAMCYLDTLFHSVTDSKPQAYKRLCLF